jgi:hypothetical protein
LRLLVLLCGVIAGIAGLGFGWWGGGASLVDLRARAVPAFTAAVVAIHLIAFASIIGGAAVLIRPRVGGVLLLLSAIAWLLMVAFLGHGLSLAMGALIALTTGGGLLAFLPSLGVPLAVIEPAEDSLLADIVPAFATRPSGRTAEPEPQDRASPFAPVPQTQPVELPRIAAGYTFEQGALRELRYQPPRRRAHPGQMTLGIAALAVIVVGASILFVAGNSWLASTQPHKPPSAVATAAAPSSSVAANSTAPAAPAPVASSQQLPASAEPAPASSAEPSSAPIAVASAFAPPPLYATPFDYCGIVANSDEPPSTGLGEGIPAEVIDGVRKVTKMPDADVRWRCMGGEVWICAQPPGGTACSRIPPVAERTAYCTAHPDAQGIEASAGIWRCEGTVPTVPADFDEKADPRGFNRLAWLALTKAPTAAGGPSG